MNKLGKKSKRNTGMTYVELIVVLSIFSVMTSVILFNYQKFQAKVDIKNLANDIAVKLVGAQKAAVSGAFPPPAQQSLIGSSWKPSYGLYFYPSTDNKSFIYFADANNDNLYQDPGCTGECIEKVLITKNNIISSVSVVYQNDPTNYNLADVTLTFTRPNSGVVVRSSATLNPGISYIIISLSSPQGINAQIKVFPSGRIQIS